MKTYVNDEAVTFKGAAIRVEPRDPAAQIWGTFEAKGIAGARRQPAVIARQHGAGKVVYFAAGLDAGYYLYAYPYQRLALKHAIQWAAPVAQSVAIEAPMCVHTSVMRQRKGESERLLVHLFSDLNTTGQHALPVDDVPLREETVPIHEIRVTFGPEYQFSRVRLEPGALDLFVERTADGRSLVTVPRLEIHAIVVGELAPAPATSGDKR
jgi:hypothetical protein